MVSESCGMDRSESLKSDIFGSGSGGFRLIGNGGEVDIQVRKTTIEIKRRKSSTQNLRITDESEELKLEG